MKSGDEEALCEKHKIQDVAIFLDKIPVFLRDDFKVNIYKLFCD